MADWRVHIKDEYGPVTFRRPTVDGETVEARIDLWGQLEMTATTAWEYMWVSREVCDALFAAHQARAGTLDSALVPGVPSEAARRDGKETSR